MKTIQCYIAAMILASVTVCVGQPATNLGKIWAPEVKTFVDKKTNVTITQLTNYKGHSHHFYFTNPGWYNGGDNLLFSSDRNNRTNLFGIDLNTYEIQQLTELEPLPLPHEIEFFSASKNPAKEEAYFWHGQNLIGLDLKTQNTKVLLALDNKWATSMTNCSADGKYVYFGIWEDQSDKFEVDILRGYVGFNETWQAKPLSRVMRVAVDGSGSEVVFEAQYWIGHINTSPARSDLLTFCQEGPWKKVEHRIWGLNAETKEVWKIRPRNEAGERIGHEYWYADGETLGFHGSRDDKGFLGRTRYDNSQLIEAEFPGTTGHIHSNDHNLIVGDGDGVIRLWKWNGSTYEGPRILCGHNSTLNIQQTHPHPRFSPDGKQVIFTSDMSGYSNVYLVDVPDFYSLPMVK
jgi:oligogalacturonide lyase